MTEVSQILVVPQCNATTAAIQGHLQDFHDQKKMLVQ